MSRVISPRFITHAANNLQYWLEKTTDLNDEQFGRLAQERQNIFRAVTVGLSIAECTKTAVQVTVQAFPLVEVNGYWREWIPVVEQAAAQPFASAQKAKLLNQLGFLHRLDGDLARAISIHHQALMLAEREQDTAELARIYFNLGTGYMHSREYGAAEQYAQLAGQAFETSDTTTPRTRAALANLMGLIASNQGAYEKSLEFYRMAIPLWERAGETLYLVRSLLNMGTALERLGSFEDALQLYDQAEKTLDEAGLELDKPAVALSRGNIYFHLRQFPQAIDAYQSADSIHLHRSGNLVLQAMIATNLGNVFLEMDDLAQAGAYLERAIDQWRDVGDKVMLGNALGTLGDVKKKGKQSAEARACLEQAIALLDQHPDDGFARMVRESCAQSLVDISY